jgi:hypothetical protein
MMENVDNNLPPLLGCGNYNVFAQIDAYKKVGSNGGFPSRWPQIDALDEMHAAYPNVTFILNTRDIDRWIKSVSKWGKLLTKFATCGQILGITRTRRKENFRSVVANFAAKYMTRTRAWLRAHPQHISVEVEIDSSTAAATLEHAFGIRQSCWRQTNVGKGG